MSNLSFNFLILVIVCLVTNKPFNGVFMEEKENIFKDKQNN